jgi:hypothetical protein
MNLVTPPSAVLDRKIRGGFDQAQRLSRQASIALVRVLPGLVSDYGHSIAGTNIRKIIPDCVVLCASVIPKRNGVLPPFEAALERWIPHVLKEKLQYSITLCLGESNDMLGEH